MDDAADEIERLRGEKDEWIGRYQAELDDNHRMSAWYKDACAERDRLREALQSAVTQIDTTVFNLDQIDPEKPVIMRALRNIAETVRAALGENDA